MYCFSFGNGTVIEMIVDKVTNDREPHTTITFHWIDDSQRNKFTFFHYDQDGRTQHPFRFIDDRSENDVVSCLSIASTLFLSPCSRLFPYPLVIMTLHLNRCHWMLTLIYHLPFSSIGTLRESRPVNRNKKIILMEDIWDNSMTFHKHSEANEVSQVKVNKFPDLISCASSFIFFFMALWDHFMSSKDFSTQSWRIITLFGKQMTNPKSPKIKNIRSIRCEM